MKNNTGFQIFISHATLDSKLANVLKGRISYALRLEKRQIFCSSDSTSLRMGKMDVAQITEGHKQAKAVVALMTPNSIYRPWVIYEAGGAHFHSAKQLFITVANGAIAECLPAPLQWWHVGSLDEPKCIADLCRLLALTLNRKHELRRLKTRQVAKIVAIAKQSVGDWENVSPALAAPALAESPFNVRNLLNTGSANSAKNKVYLIGQHLYWITKPKSFFRNYKSAIFGWLQKEKGRQFCIMISDVRDRMGIEPWNLIHSPDFQTQLENSTKTLKKWVKEAKSKKLSFTVKVTPFVPIGATFVDPSMPTGLMVLKPVVYGTGNTERPQFILGKKQNKLVFEHYWNAFQKVLDKAEELG